MSSLLDEKLQSNLLLPSQHKKSHNLILTVEHQSEVFKKKYLLCPDMETTWTQALGLIERGKGAERSQGTKNPGR